MITDTEDELIQAAKHGDEAAFEKLISQYEKKIYHLCVHILGPQEAYDAAQEVCVKVWLKLKDFKGEAKLSTWIYRLTTNYCIDVLRKNKKHNVQLLFSEEEIKHYTEDKKDCIQKAADELLEEKMMGEVIQLGISYLKPKQRIILCLRDIEGYSYEQIAEILQLPLGTVKSRILRARKALREVLEQDKEPFKSFFRPVDKEV